MTKPSAWKKTSAVFLLCVATAIAARAQTFTKLVDFNRTNGAAPGYESLVQGADGSLYGTTEAGGNTNTVCGILDCGTVFKITRTGRLVTLYKFCGQTNCVDGYSPAAGLILAADGNFYGTTTFGGVNRAGTLFRITPGGSLTILHSFAPVTEGSEPISPLVQAPDGSFYGTASGGGSAALGTVFRLAPDGVLTNLHSFMGYPTDGAYPYAGLIQGNDGKFYGTTYVGGANESSECPAGCGTVFSITPAGGVTTLYSFCALANCADGAYPIAALTQENDESFYGSTHLGGGNFDGGTIFRISRNGTLATLHLFCSRPKCEDGASPYGQLALATDGNLYGTTSGGGGSGKSGTLFGMNPWGGLATLYSLTSSSGTFPEGGLVQGTDGIFYGTATAGGIIKTCNGGCGTAFGLSTGLSPFVAFIRNPAKIGQDFGILGQGFIGTTSVSLNGIPAAFTVVSDTSIRATVPVGATTGYVIVTTPSGTLTSNVPFHVIK